MTKGREALKASPMAEPSTFASANCLYFTYSTEKCKSEFLRQANQVVCSVNEFLPRNLRPLLPEASSLLEGVRKLQDTELALVAADNLHAHR